MSAATGKTVAVIGGGLAGLAAGSALADAGFRVSLFERRPYLGGRASSYEHPGTGEIVDNCQHVLLGCCTNLIDFYRRLGVEGKIRWFDKLNFIEPGGRTSVIGPSLLPAPFHSSPSFVRAKFLDAADKDAIARGLLRVMGHLPEDGNEHFLHWLERHGQTEQAIERFWKPVLVSALNEDLTRISVRYAAQVFHESFLKCAAAGRLGIPRVPLTELYSVAGEYIRSRGGQVALRCGVEAIRSSPHVRSVGLLVGGQERKFDFVISAVPFEALARMLPEATELSSLRNQLARFETSPITGIHLWFDREITALEHAVLLDRTIQWMFNKSKLIAARAEGGSGSYLELVVSSSKSLLNQSKQEILDLALRELKEFFPAAGTVTLVKGTVIKEVNATYSALPGADAYRPAATTAWPHFFLAGDWTATGWPATMEGAVRSGYRAAESVLYASDPGRKLKFLVADIPATGFMRLLG
ncbi:MAG: hydroxysqualene dehydroxylase HpnE [Acidobacteriales bacterium]|nr:hydroxysqualene dehydroxylase HpnE [Terriglobales bacterium]